MRELQSLLSEAPDYSLYAIEGGIVSIQLGESAYYIGLKETLTSKLELQLGRDGFEVRRKYDAEYTDGELTANWVFLNVTVNVMDTRYKDGTLTGKVIYVVQLDVNELHSLRRAHMPELPGPAIVCTIYKNLLFGNSIGEDADEAIEDSIEDLAAVFLSEWKKQNNDVTRQWLSEFEAWQNRMGNKSAGIKAGMGKE